VRRAKISDNLLDIYLMEKTEISRKNIRSTIVYSVRLINVSRYWRRSSNDRCRLRRTGWYYCLRKTKKRDTLRVKRSVETRKKKQKKNRARAERRQSSRS